MVTGVTTIQQMKERIFPSGISLASMARIKMEI